MIPASNINIKPVVYQKNTDGSYELDTSGNKIINKLGTEVSPYDDYEIIVTIKEDFFIGLNDIEIRGIINN